jgi:hypothetical protein
VAASSDSEAAATAAASFEPCAHDQVCGLKNAEDLVLVPGSHWAIAGRLAKDPQAPGGFSPVDLEKLTSRVLRPDVSKPAAAEYSACPGAPGAADLVTHGLDVRRRKTGGPAGSSADGRRRKAGRTSRVANSAVTMA